MGAVIGCLVGLVPACNGSAAASEVIAAIPGAAESPVMHDDVIDTIEVGTRGGARPRHAHGGGCKGTHCGHGRCSHGACRRDGCEIPGCPAHCPVRPASFGYYDTRWRTWPGHGGEQASGGQPAAPVMPPKSEVPTADEESPVPGFESAPAAAPESTPADRQEMDAETSILPPPDADRESNREPAAEPAAEPAEKPAEKRADEKPAQEKSDDANLFDEATLRRRSQERLAQLGQVAIQQERLRREALRQQAPRIARPSTADAAVKQATHLEAEPRHRPQ
jgi:hypothetical protein